MKKTRKKIEEEIEKMDFRENDESLFNDRGIRFCELNAKLSGYKLALKDVLSEIDEWFKGRRIIKGRKVINSQSIEELKKPIQEVLK